MLKLLKVFGRGVLVTVLSPFILLIWVLYGVFCIFLFIFMFIKGTIGYFRGDNIGSDLKEDLEAKRMLLEAEKADDQAKKMLNAMYEKTLNSGDKEETFSLREDEKEETDVIDDLLKEEDDASI